MTPEQQRDTYYKQLLDLRIENSKLLKMIDDLRHLDRRPGFILVETHSTKDFDTVYELVHRVVGSSQYPARVTKEKR